VFSGDLLSATISNSKPILEYPSISQSVLTALGLPLTLTSPLNTTLNLNSFTIEILSTIKIISQLVYILSQPVIYPFTSLDDIILLNQICCVIEHRLLSAEVYRTEDSESYTSVYELARIAALTAANHNFRTFSRGTTLFRSLHETLKQQMMVFESQTNPLLDEFSLRLLLWTCWWGGMASSTDSEFFALRIRRCSRLLGYTTLENLEFCLKSFLWTSEMHDGQSRSLWEEIRSEYGRLDKQNHSFS